MKCPKYIKEALDKRLKAAQQFNHYDLIVSEYIDKHDLDVDSCHYHGGCESTVFPESSYHTILEAIKEK